MQARYFDTSDHALAQCGLVVRVRKEGTRWVQTAKATSGKNFERLEHNVDLPRQVGGALPDVDLSRHAGTRLESKLREALGAREGDPFPALSITYETDVVRQVLAIKSGRSSVEVAFDRGHVGAGTHQTPLCEVEFELKHGKPRDAVQLARTWCARHGLWLSSISKSAKGRRLLNDAPAAAVPNQPVRLKVKACLREAVGKMVLHCMAQVLPHASDVGGGSTDRDQIHQLRVGLRHLRSVLRELGDSAHEIDATWEAELARVFRLPGEHRDAEFVGQQMQAQLAVAGGPEISASPAAKSPDPGLAVRSGAFQDTLLDLLVCAHNCLGNEKGDGNPAVASQTDPQAWFGVGWLTATRQDNALACQRDLKALGSLDKFW